jgi:hypothetical protein
VATACTAAQPGEVGLGAGFIQKDQPLCGHLALGRFPELAPLSDVRAFLFAGPQRFFYNGSRVGAACCG